MLTLSSFHPSRVRYYAAFENGQSENLHDGLDDELAVRRVMIPLDDDALEMFSPQQNTVMLQERFTDDGVMAFGVKSFHLPDPTPVQRKALIQGLMLRRRDAPVLLRIVISDEAAAALRARLGVSQTDYVPNAAAVQFFGLEGVHLDLLVPFRGTPGSRWHKINSVTKQTESSGAVCWVTTPRPC